MKPFTKLVSLGAVLLLVTMASMTPMVQEVNATLGETLTITHGGSGTWVTGGYHFLETAYATKAGFRPLANSERFTMLVWLELDDLAGADGEVIGGSYLNGDNQARVWFRPTDDTFKAAIGDSFDSIAVVSGVIGAAGPFMISMCWDKDLNSGKMDMYVNTTKTTSATGQTLAISANDDMDIGRNTDAVQYFEGSMFSFLIFDYKLDSAEISDYHTNGPDYETTPAPLYRWFMTEGEGNYFYEYPPDWILAQEVTQVLTIPIFEGSLNATIVLIGLALMPLSTSWLAVNKDDLSQKKIMIFLALFIFGWCMFLGGMA